MSGFYGDGIWGEEYFSPDYWDGTRKKETPTKTGDIGGPGHWAPEFWANEYWGDQYWYNTRLHELEYSIVQPTKVGGDDVPVYHKHKHKGWNKKAWLKQKQKEDALLKTIQDTLKPPKKKKKYVPDYDAILQQLRKVDDEEAAILLL